MEDYGRQRSWRIWHIERESVSHMTRLRLWSEKLIQTVVIKFTFTTMANVLRGAVENWKAFQQR